MQANGVNWLLCLLAKGYEQFLGQFGDQHLTVSKAFKQDMTSRFGIRETAISVLYDRAVSGKFRSLDVNEKHTLFGKINYEGVFTEETNGMV